MIRVLTSPITWWIVAAHYIPTIIVWVRVELACPSATHVCGIVPNHGSKVANLFLRVSLAAVCEVVKIDFCVPPVRSIGVINEKI